MYCCMQWCSWCLILATSTKWCVADKFFVWWILESSAGFRSEFWWGKCHFPCSVIVLVVFWHSWLFSAHVTLVVLVLLVFLNSWLLGRVWFLCSFSAIYDLIALSWRSQWIHYDCLLLVSREHTSIRFILVIEVGMFHGFLFFQVC